jgi:predicted nucleic acid-binding protein
LIAIDTSSFSRYLAGIRAEDTRLVAEALGNGIAVVPGVAVTELLSNPELSGGSRSIVLSVRIPKVLDGFWRRAAALRRGAVTEGYNSAIADVLIAQTCIDYDLPLVTYDSDFRAFVGAGLQLA